MENHHVQWLGKSIISMDIFNSKLLVHQRFNPFDVDVQLHAEKHSGKDPNSSQVNIPTSIHQG